MVDYSKYYNLEEYLVNEVGRSFRESGYICSLDFYCILIWKSNRAKTKHLARLTKSFGSFDRVVQVISKNIWLAKPMEKLRYLLKDGKFRIATASAILAILYPDDFTVYDYRVCEALNEYKKLGNRTDVDEIIDEYMNFKNAVLKEAECKKGLRDKDRYLWGHSFYNGIQADLKNFLIERPV